MLRQGVFCLVLGTMAWGQATNGSAPPEPPLQTVQPGTAPASPTAPVQPREIGPDTPVITLQGVCDKALAKPQAECKTVVTRTEFEKLISALDPTMAPGIRRRFAGQYARALTLASRAHDMGLDQGPKFEELMQVVRIQALAQLTTKALQEKAAQIPDKDIEDYYQKNQSSFEQANLERVFVPKSRQAAASTAKLTDAATKKRDTDAEALMKAKAEALRARAVKGEKLETLQAEAFQYAGLKVNPPSTNLGAMRPSSLPPDHQSVVELRAGEISPLLTDSTGYYFYKSTGKTILPLSAVREDIQRTLTGQRLQQYAQELEHSYTTTFDDTYFPALPSGPAPASQHQPELGPIRPPARVPTSQVK